MREYLISQSLHLRSASIGDHAETIAVKFAEDNHSTNRAGFIRFDISSFLPGPAAINSISLELDVTRFDKGTGNAIAASFFLFGLANGGADENFDEGSLTYTNATGLNGTGDFIDNNNANFANSGIPLAEFTINGAGTVVIPQTSELLAFINADDNNLVSFFISRKSTGNVDDDKALSTDFASRETTVPGASGARLLVAVPEPSTGLLTVATLGLLALRRKR